MHPIDETKQRVANLIETNRALCDDLDANRRILTAIGHERDALRRELARRGGQEQGAPTTETLRTWRRDIERLRSALAGQHAQAEADQERLRRSEERIAELTEELAQVEEDREALRLDLREATEALEEIRSRLEGDLESATPPDHVAWLG